MRKIVYMIWSGLLLSGCSLSETTDIEVDARPSLTVSYHYLNKDGIDATQDEIHSLDLYIFDPMGHFIKKVEADRRAAEDTSGLRLLDGVPAGEYTVVCFGNVKRITIPKLVPGESTTADLFAVEKQGDTCPDADRLFHSLTRFEVRRGEPHVRTVDLDKHYFLVDLTVNGAEKLVVTPDKMAVLFTGIPSGTDYKGDPVFAQTAFSPRLQQTQQGFSATFAVYSFDMPDPVRMIVQAGSETVGQVNLGEYIARHDLGIDLRNDRDVVLPIDIDVTTTGITITVNDWDDGAIQLPIIGK
ncbi:FimB/Mfa2 family fimbrial subunit [Alistipes indistinctus]|nr:FimB/Mfa2 family fimbrial subunit [Alistipes indistinctus]UWN59644.1 FimB/Mfa2 family fimbrial subunit [Alistipes indistinctus YIT 12060]